MSGQPILSPTDFIAITNQILETSFGFVYIQGELSSFRISKGKWVYFDIKDENAKVACFASIYALPGPLQDGIIVKIGGSARLHPQFGFSVTAQSISPVGEGSLAQALQLLAEKLGKEGLFAVERKRLLPKIPKKIALVASVESAAYADFCKILQVRWPFCEVEVFDTLVQGENAPNQLVNAINLANSKSNLADVLVITRGGGSADDLAAFNDERVVRVVASSRIPTMVAIGHEIDECLSELAADVRASTPSNAAELIAPDRLAEQESLYNMHKQLTARISSFTALQRASLRLYKNRLVNSVSQLISQEKANLLSNKHLLMAYNPNNVLKRGYAIVRSSTGKVITSAQTAKKESIINITFKDSNINVKMLSNNEH